MSLEIMYLYFWKSMALHPENRKDVTVITTDRNHIQRSVIRPQDICTPIKL